MAFVHSESDGPDILTSNGFFTSQLFYNIIKKRRNENVIFSPAAIQTCLALVYLGAEGTTATELQIALQLGDADKQQVATKFGKLFEKTGADGATIFRIANRIYLDQRFQLSPKYNELVNKYFNTAAENVKFSESVPTAEKINKWVEQVTGNKIRNVVDANNLSASTDAVLVNALCFKAKWASHFSTKLTSPKDFGLSRTYYLQAHMMLQSGQFLYGELEDLEAQVLEMNYLGTDVTMMVILPTDIEGLSALEEKLKDVNLIKLTEKLTREDVLVDLPRFKIEYDLSLQPIFSELGLSTMFNDNANFSKLLTNEQRLTISEAKHKAFIEVNESGSAEDPETSLKAVSYGNYVFEANHPFVIVIKDRKNVYLIGHVATMDYEIAEIKRSSLIKNKSEKTTKY